MTGSLFGSGGKQSSSSAPAVWAPQEPFLKFGMNEAQNIYDQVKGTPGYSGAYYAGLNPHQGQTLASMYNEGASLGGQALGVNQAGMANIPYAGQFGQNAASTFARSQMDPTQQIYNQGTQLANSPYTSDMIKAATRDDVRAVTEGSLPQLSNEASATGNAYGSRAGVAQGVIQRGLQDTIADTSANIRGSMFNKGLDMAQSQWNQNIANMRGANADVGGAGTLGANLLSTGSGLMGTGFDWQNAAGGAYQADQQARLDETYRKWAEGQNRPWDQLSNYWSVAGWGGGPGTSSTSTTTGPSMGILPGILGAASAGMGIYGTGARYGLWGGGAR